MAFENPIPLKILCPQFRLNETALYPCLTLPEALPSMAVLHSDDRSESIVGSNPVSIASSAATFDRPTNVSVLVFPGFSMMAFASTTEPLRVANWISGRTLYKFPILSSGVDDPVSSSGIRLRADGHCLAMPPADLLLVIVSLDFSGELQADVLSRLRKAANESKAVGGICDGSLLLARAGLMEGYRCTGHWGRLREMHDVHPASMVTHDVYCIDRDRWSCSGGAPAMHMMLALIRCQHGQALAGKVSDALVCGSFRPPGEMQPLEPHWRYRVKDKRLAKAIGFMAQSVEAPMKLDEIACLVGVSTRQLQRLFIAELGSSPEQFNVDMRLRLARELLEQGGDSIRSIALQSGFSDPSHFARSFQIKFGCRPSEIRRAAVKSASTAER